MSYNRENDFFDYQSIHESYFDLPAIEIFYFCDLEDSKWKYEVIDNRSLSLTDFNNLHELHTFNFPCKVNEEAVYNFLERSYPGASIVLYACKEDWELDLLEGGWK